MIRNAGGFGVAAIAEIVGGVMRPESVAGTRARSIGRKTGASCVGNILRHRIRALAKMGDLCPCLSHKSVAGANAIGPI